MSAKFSVRKKSESIWMLPGYMDGIREAGGLPVIFPFSSDEQELNQLINMCDGFLESSPYRIICAVALP